MAGRKSFVTIDAGSYGLPDSRPRPPASLGEAERRVFCDLIASCPAGQFQASDTPLLCRWAELSVLCEVAMAEMTAHGVVDGDKPSAWFGVYQQSVRSLALMAMRLRLGPQSRTRFSPKTRPQSMSFFDKQRLEGRHDGEEDQSNAH
jgi:hypothetical protein